MDQRSPSAKSAGRTASSKNRQSRKQQIRRQHRGCRTKHGPQGVESPAVGIKCNPKIPADVIQERRHNNRQSDPPSRLVRGLGSVERRGRFRWTLLRILVHFRLRSFQESCPDAHTAALPGAIPGNFGRSGRGTSGSRIIGRGGCCSFSQRRWQETPRMMSGQLSSAVGRQIALK